MLACLNPHRIFKGSVLIALIRYTAVCAGKFLLVSFFGYAAYYLVRKNFALAFPSLMEQGFSKGELGTALSAISIAYGLSKFIMGSFSDRANPRYFLPTGLILASAVMLIMGFCDWATSSVWIMAILLFLCGWFQGDGLAAVRTHHGALVVTEGARRNCINLELCP
ncbi:G-3-P permease [Morganella morganii]|nr:G-3-P permease [Morganella morganii]